MSTATIHIQIPKLQNAGRSRDFLEIQVLAGERLSLVGPNGSGKTTLLRTLLGFKKTNDIQITVSEKFSTSKAYVPQDYRKALFPWLTLEHNLTLSDKSPEQLSKLREDFEQIAKRFRLRINLQKYPYQISGGEQQLFVLIRALIMEPSFLALDEPLSAVDYARRLIAQQVLSEYCAASNCTCFLATHDFEEAVFLADKIIVFHGFSGVNRILEVAETWPREQTFRASEPFQATVRQIASEVL